eukprot:10161546-Alexandrium_andersonii.AAC.1
MERVAPLAPSTLAELMKWPITNIGKLRAAVGEPLNNLQHWLEKGINFSTAYSGVGAPELAARCLEVGFAM